LTDEELQLQEWLTNALAQVFNAIGFPTVESYLREHENKSRFMS